MIDRFLTNTSALPDLIPVFPLANVLLLPGGNLPLNIFESRYLDMVDHALQTNRIIGMIQPHPEQNTELYDIGCAGKIVSFTETEDGRYLITLKGVSRFIVKTEQKRDKLFREFDVDWTAFHQDVELEDTVIENKDQFMPLLKTYFKKQNLSCDWHVIEAADDEKLVTVLSMVCPFSPEEKQMLLESPSHCDRAKKLMALLEIDTVLNCISEDHLKH